MRRTVLLVVLSAFLASLAGCVDQGPAPPVEEGGDGSTGSGLDNASNPGAEHGDNDPEPPETGATAPPRPSQEGPENGSRATNKSFASTSPGAPSSPLISSLRLDDGRALFENETIVRLVIARAVVVDYSGLQLHAGIVIPPGVEVLHGKPNFTGPANASLPLHLNVTLRATSLDEVAFVGWADIPPPVGSHATSVTLGIRANGTDVEAFEVDRPYRVFEVWLEADPDQPTRLAVTVNSPIQTEVRLVLWNTTYGTPISPPDPVYHPITPGNHTLAVYNISQPSGEPCTSHDPCHMQIEASLLPHPSLYTNAFNDAIAYTFADGNVTFSYPYRTPPTEPQEPPPATGP